MDLDSGPGAPIDEIEQMLGPMVAENGCLLLDVEYRREPAGWVLRLVVDHLGGLIVDDLATISRQAGDLLDVYSGLDGPYSLEVTSPGLDRTLKRGIEFSHFAGRRVKVILRAPDQGSPVVVGSLVGLDEGRVVVRTGGDRENGGGEQFFDLDGVKQVRLYPEGF